MLKSDCFAAAAKGFQLPAISVLFLASFVWGQMAPSVQTARTSCAAGELAPGVVVESVGKNSDAAKAGLLEGDLILSWSQNGVGASIASPFDLFSVEVEAAPRGSVSLFGARGTEPKAWTLGQNTWDIGARPNLPQYMLTTYRRAEDLAKSGKLAEAVTLWQMARIEGQKCRWKWFEVWLSFHAAQFADDARQWKLADGFYQQAVEPTRQVEPAVMAQLFRAWAASFEHRNAPITAEKYYSRALLPIEKSDGESLLSADILGALGRVAEQRGDLDRADNYHRHALAIREKLIPDSLDVAASLFNLGIVASDRGELGKAHEYYSRSLAIRQKGDPDSLKVAASLNNLGNVSWKRGDLAEADDYYSRALTIRAKLAPQSLPVASTLHNLANIAEDRGDLAKAEQYFREALTIQAKVAPVSLDMALNLNNLGNVAYDRGDLTQAETYYRRALALREKLAPGALPVAYSLENLGNILHDRGHWAEADLNYRRALAIEKKLSPGSLDEAENLLNLGIVAFEHAALAKALKYQKDALEIRDKLAPNSLAVAEVLSSLGDLSRRLGKLDDAERQYRAALEIRRRLTPDSTLYAESLAALGRVTLEKGRSDTAADLLQEALNALESQSARLGGTGEVRAGFRAIHAAYYEDYIDLLMTQGHSELAFHVQERSRARTFLETLAAAHVDVRQGVDPALVLRERSLRASLNSKSNRRIELLEDKHTDEQVAAVDKELAELLSQHGEVEQQLRISSPGYSALTQPQPLKAKQVQEQLLDSDTLLLEYALGKERSYLFALTTTSLNAYKLPKRSAIEPMARHLYDLLSSHHPRTKGETSLQRKSRLARADADYEKTAATLSRMIIGPVAGQLKGKRLLIVSDGALQYIPFAVLPMPTTSRANGTTTAAAQPEPLVTEHEIVILPSASVLAVLRQEENSRPAWTKKAVAVLADPVFDRNDSRVAKAKNLSSSVKLAPPADMLSMSESAEDRVTRSVGDIGMRTNRGSALPRLMFTRQEAASILSAAPADQGMAAMDFQASRATATSAVLAQYRIVHFATHGLLDNQHPELSGLVLSMVDQEGKPQDGFLNLEDVYNLNLPVDLVVLSACETGLGKEVRGEGLVGLTRGFMYAGAPRVVASLWRVDDVATANLMGRFYRAMLQQDLRPAAALRQAQLEMWKQKRWHDPYYWAAFTIQGEWK